ncbi:hypothetical protein LINPERHAP2_LOCUS13464, partial [Linum perenne]
GLVQVLVWVMSRDRPLRAHEEFQYVLGDAEVLCHCRMRASIKISYTEANPGRKFFGCPRYVSKIESGCGFFVWYDVKLAAATEKQELVRLVDILRNRIHALEYENDKLRMCLRERSEVGSITDKSVTTELESLTKRVSQLEMSSSSGFRDQK